MKNNKKKLNIKKGFTLIEVMVAIAIFATIIVASSGVFASIFKSYRGAKNVNENLKNGQYAMNLMNKTFRTSKLISPAYDSSDEVKKVSSIQVCDYSQSKCFEYEFASNVLLRSESVATISGGDCTCDSLGAPEAMTSGEINGSFNVVNSYGEVVNDVPVSTRVGKITTVMEISNGSGFGQTRANLQSSVSLRDYQTSNIGIDFFNAPL